MFLDYKALTQTVTARDNTISKVVLTIPPKTLIPEGCEAYIILDVFPVQKLKIRELKQ